MNIILQPYNPNAALEKMAEIFQFSTPAMMEMIKDFKAQMQAGLEGKESRINMFPSYATIPCGKEKGYAVAVDMGGTNLRVMLVYLSGNSSPRVLIQNSAALSKEEMGTTASVLFHRIAGQINDLLVETEKQKFKVPVSSLNMGFTFSYPVDMTSPVSGKINRLTKQLTASGLVGNDPFTLLISQFSKIQNQSKKFPLSCLKPKALLNDTVTELIYASYLKQIESSSYICKSGGIIGTGNNFSILLNTGVVKKFNDASYDKLDMIINMESGNFNAPSLPRTVYDDIVDRESSNIGCNNLEKIVSGNYLGRLVSLACKDMIEAKCFFIKEPDAYDKIDGFSTITMSTLQGLSSAPKDLHKAVELFKELGMSSFGSPDTNIVNYISTLVSTRASRVAAANVAAIVEFTDPLLKGRYTIAIDGSVFGKYPGYKEKMEAALFELYGDKAQNIKLEYISDGSGIGAAIAALSNEFC